MNNTDLKRKIDEIAENYISLLIICEYCKKTICDCGSIWAQNEISTIRKKHLTCDKCGKSAVRFSGISVREQ